MRRPTFVQFRTAALFIGGMVGAGYVTLVDSTDRPTLLILFGAMMGLPLFLKVDEKHIELPPPPPPPPPSVSGSPSVTAPAAPPEAPQ
jgi:hypothetical protein